MNHMIQTNPTKQKFFRFNKKNTDDYTINEYLIKLHESGKYTVKIDKKSHSIEITPNSSRHTSYTLENYTSANLSKADLFKIVLFITYTDTETKISGMFSRIIYKNEDGFIFDKEIKYFQYPSDTKYLTASMLEQITRDQFYFVDDYFKYEDQHIKDEYNKFWDFFNHVDATAKYMAPFIQKYGYGIIAPKITENTIMDFLSDQLKRTERYELNKLIESKSPGIIDMNQVELDIYSKAFDTKITIDTPIDILEQTADDINTHINAYKDVKNKGFLHYAELVSSQYKAKILKEFIAIQESKTKNPAP